MKTMYVALCASLLVGTAAAVLSPYRAITPGVLSPGHERHRDACLACHEPFRGATRAKCVRCHEPAGIALRTAAGDARPVAAVRPAINDLHGALGTLECRTCHPEHSGQSRAGAGERFTHDILPTETRGQCAICHDRQRPRDALHASAGSACATCHGTAAWKPSTFAHEKYFVFDRHHPARCADCHPPGDFKAYGCYGCHEHRRDGMIAEHAKEGIAVELIDRCARCHPSGNEHDARRDGITGGRERGESRDREGGEFERDEDD